MSPHENLTQLIYDSQYMAEHRFRNINYNERCMVAHPATLPNLRGEIAVGSFDLGLLTLYKVNSSCRGLFKATKQLHRAYKEFTPIYQDWIGEEITETLLLIAYWQDYNINFKRVEL